MAKLNVTEVLARDARQQRKRILDAKRNEPAERLRAWAGKPNLPETPQEARGRIKGSIRRLEREIANLPDADPARAAKTARLRNLRRKLEEVNR